MVSKIFIDGEAGTAGLQIRDRLANRRDLELLTISPEKRKNIEARKHLLNSADVAILCLPDEAAIESVGLIESETTRVIDASSAFRVSDGWAYGFPEMDTGQAKIIANARRVSNPGCWPQGAIASLRPLVSAGLIPADYPLAIHGISGYSGGGRAKITEYESSLADQNKFLPYGLALNHKHVPEFQTYCKLSTRPLFTPTVGHFRQGMVVVVPLQMSTFSVIPSGAQLHAVIADHFASIPAGFVEVAPYNDDSEINPESYNNTNRMRLHVYANDKTAQAVLYAVYDNLGKGASGSAVQSLNLMLGYVEANTPNLKSA